MLFGLNFVSENKAKVTIVSFPNKCLKEALERGSILFLIKFRGRAAEVVGHSWNEQSVKETCDMYLKYYCNDDSWLFNLEALVIPHNQVIVTASRIASNFAIAGEYYLDLSWRDTNNSYIDPEHWANPFAQFATENIPRSIDEYSRMRVTWTTTVIGGDGIYRTGYTAVCDL